jgi:hypothetical protein
LVGTKQQPTTCDDEVDCLESLDDDPFFLLRGRFQGGESIDTVARKKGYNMENVNSDDANSARVTEIYKNQLGPSIEERFGAEN